MECQGLAWSSAVVPWASTARAHTHTLPMGGVQVLVLLEHELRSVLCSRLWVLKGEATGQDGERSPVLLCVLGFPVGDYTVRVSADCTRACFGQHLCV